MAFANPPYAAHVGGQDEKSLMGVVGTLGTADTGGTANILPVSVDPTTGALFVNNIGASSGGGGTNVNIVTGTMQTLGTVGNLNNGSVNILSGSVVGTILGGTIQNLNAGTLTAVTTVTTVSNLTNGSVNILSGTLQSSGTTTGVGVVTALTTGSIIIQSGTLTAGTLPVVTTVSNLTNGSINLLTGTLTSLTNLANGTLAQVTNLNGGTVQVNNIPAVVGISTFGTHGTTGVTVFGTLAGGTSSGAGTEIFVTSVSLSMPSTAGSQDVSIGWGTNGGTFHAGTGRIVRGNFPAGGGIIKFFDPPINSGTNAQLTVFQAGAGTVEVDVTYFVTASTI